MEQEPMRFTFMKFGGGALKDLSPPIVDLTDQWITELTLPGTIPLVTVSALGGVTDELEHIYGIAREGRFEDGIAELNSLLGRHRQIVNENLTGRQYQFTSSFKELCNQAREALRRLLPIRKAGTLIDPDESIKAELLATGELLSALLMKTRLDAKGYGTYLLHGNGFMLGTVTGDSSCTAARLMHEESRIFLRNLLEEDRTLVAQALIDPGGGVTPASKKLIVVPGFIGSLIEDPAKTVNFGRESSDLTAIEAALALSGYGAKAVVHFIKDVDPQRPIKAVTWSDVLEMQRATGTHLIGESAIKAAIAGNVYGVIVDMTTGARYEIRP